MNKHARAIYEALCEIPVIDTHEHLDNEQRHPQWNVLSDYTRHYFSCDLISAGLPPADIEWLAQPGVPILGKWARIEPHWEHCRHTGYGMMLDLAAARLYGVPEINSGTIEAVEAGFQALRAEPGFSTRMLRETCGIETVIDNTWRMDGDSAGGLYRFVTQIDDWVMFERGQQGLPEGALENCGTLRGWIELCLDSLERDFAEHDAIGLKCALAYRRSIDFDAVSRERAERGFELIKRGERDFDAGLIKAAQDYVMHAILGWANARKALLQVHTGYQEGNANLLANSNPEPLCKLIPAYPDIRFDLFHMGFPYQHVAGALGKMFPNVRIDLCWAHILSPVATRAALGEWLRLMPANKIFGFGGDCLFFDGTVGHLELARRNIAHVLGSEVEGGMSMARAARLGRMLMYDNPKEFYHL